jgi:predicted nucleotidyltransferase
MNLKETIKNNALEFVSLCRSHHVKTLYAFGSSTNLSFKEESSDIDLLVEIETTDPIQRGEELMDLWDKFELFFQRKVDLLTHASVKNPILWKNIDANKFLLYDGKEQKVSF